jgi:hypothetical protein
MMNKRASVEVHQLTLWKQQQTIEEIKMLKANNAIPAGAKATATNSNSKSAISGLGSPSKVSKLSARLLRGSSEIPSGPTSSMLKVSKDEQNASLAQQPSPSGLRPAIPTKSQASLDILGKAKIVYNSSESEKSDIEVLLREKQLWLKLLHEDNMKMAQMLKVRLYYIIWRALREVFLTFFL